MPLLSIADSLKIYSRMHAPEPEFGQDVFRINFEGKRAAILSNNGRGNKGIPIRCDHFVLALCVSGSAHRRINQHRFIIDQGSAHLIVPGQIHSFSNATSDFELYLMLFEESYLKESGFASKVSAGTKLVLEDQEFERWKTIFSLISDDAKKEGVTPKFSGSLLVHLMHRLERLSVVIEDRKSSRSVILVNEFRSLVEEFFLIERTVTDYAARLGITTKHLSETVKKETGSTALEVIHQRLLNESQFLLYYTNLTVKEIAHQLNFDTPSHFGRFFTQRTGMSPRGYRYQ